MSKNKNFFFYEGLTESSADLVRKAINDLEKLASQLYKMDAIRHNPDVTNGKMIINHAIVTVRGILTGKRAEQTSVNDNTMPESGPSSPKF